MEKTMNEPKFAERLKNKIQERLGSSRDMDW
jgi:hypothetical protein